MVSIITRQGASEEFGMTSPKTKGSLEGAKLRPLRLRLRFTQDGLAQKVGVTTHTIWRLENHSAQGEIVLTPKVSEIVLESFLKAGAGSKNIGAPQTTVRA
jgi:DNA-binding XRE family transcriptional regulator